MSDCPPYDPSAPLPERMKQLQKRQRYWYEKVRAATEDISE